MRNKIIIAVLLVLVPCMAYGHRDQSTELAPLSSLTIQSCTTGTTTGSGVDLATYESATVIVDFGTWVGGTHKIQIQDSANNSDFTTVAAAYLAGATVSVATSTAVDNMTYWFGYLGSNRYIRAAAVVSGATGGATYGVTILRGRPKSMPTY